MLELLVNSAGNIAHAITVSSTTLQSGEIANSVAGGRTQLVRLTSSASGDVVYSDYNETDTSINTDYFIISGAHFLKTEDTTRVTPLSSALASGSMDTHTDVQAVIADANLVGPYSQDWIATKALTSKKRHGMRFETQGGGAEAAQYYQIFAAASFDLGIEPIRPLVYEQIPKSDEMFQPQRGWFPYATEMRITVNWKHVTAAKSLAFKSLGYLTSRPFFLYDSTGDTISHKLEHVVLESYRESVLRPDIIEISATFRRLKHYL